MSVSWKFAFLLVNFKHIWVDERGGHWWLDGSGLGFGAESFGFHPPSREISTKSGPLKHLLPTEFITE